MSVPALHDLTLPLLQSFANGEERVFADVVGELADQFELTPEERNARIPSGTRIFCNRVGWARCELRAAGLLRSRPGGRNQITPNGEQVLKSKPERIDRKFLARFSKPANHIAVQTTEIMAELGVQQEFAVS